MINGRYKFCNQLLIGCLYIQIVLIKASEIVHKNCRNGIYPRSMLERFPVPDNLVAWSTSYPDYKPPFYDAPSIKGKPWADPLIEGRLKYTIIRTRKRT